MAIIDDAGLRSRSNSSVFRLALYTELTSSNLDTCCMGCMLKFCREDCTVLGAIMATVPASLCIYPQLMKQQQKLHQCDDPVGVVLNVAG